MIRTWKITNENTKEMTFPNAPSLDAITRQLPDGYYSTFRTYDGCMRVLGLKAHLRRLPDVDASFLRRQLNQLLEPYRPDEARIRVMKTRQGQLYVSIEPLKLLPREVYEKGVRVETVEIERDTPRVKSTAFISQSDEERRHIAEKGIFEALLVKNGRILEGMTSNFFYVRDGILYTAQKGVLLGITRRTILRVANKINIKITLKSLQIKDLEKINEAFITSSSRGIVPVIQIDETMIGDGKPGNITKRLMSVYTENILKMTEKI